MSVIICPICKADDRLAKFKIIEATCGLIKVPWLDQKLIRHSCPQCGVIFGSQQMLNLTKEKLTI